MSKHTEAPWFYRISSNQPDYFEITNDDDTTIGLVERWDGDCDADLMMEAHCNAGLITQAPKMFAVLKKALEQNMLTGMARDIAINVMSEIDLMAEEAA